EGSNQCWSRLDRARILYETGHTATDEKQRYLSFGYVACDRIYYEPRGQISAGAPGEGESCAPGALGNVSQRGQDRCEDRARNGFFRLSARTECERVRVDDGTRNGAD